MSNVAKVFAGIVAFGAAVALCGIAIMRFNTVQGVGPSDVDQLHSFMSSAVTELVGFLMLVVVSPALILIGLGGFFAAILSPTAKK